MVHPLLAVENLQVRYAPVGAPAVDAVRGISFSLAKGETLALVGESGSGKSAAALSVLQLLPYPVASHPGGSIRLDGEEMIGARPARLREIRGGRVGMVFQEPMSSLNPLHSVGRQIGETLAIHRAFGRTALRTRALELLDLVGLDRPELRLTQLPHELSGGQRQRVMIAMALANDPDLLIADEPTTALDVTIQAQILALLKELQGRLGMALLLITHNLSIVRKMADRVAVMQQGRIVEAGGVADVLAAPAHAYTRALIEADPEGRPRPVPDAAAPLLEARDMVVHFQVRRGLLGRVAEEVKAVDGVDIAIRESETVGVVGESGSGKTTLGLALLGLTRSRGSVRLAGREIQGLDIAAFRPLRRQIQVVFQDPFGALSPRLSVGEIVGEGLRVHGLARDEAERRAAISQALADVGLQPEMADRYPHEFSGGQRQRIAIARALVLQPRLIVLDEPTSALDRSVQRQVIELLRALQARHGLSYLFISHDLAVVRAMSHRILVMQGGKVVEAGTADAVFEAPQHPYTQALLKAAVDLEAA